MDNRLRQGEEHTPNCKFTILVVGQVEEPDRVILNSSARRMPVRLSAVRVKFTSLSRQPMSGGTTLCRGVTEKLKEMARELVSHVTPE
ncbi:hypothetical protein RHGRI_017400 [Rhododendron griersonianum]|uniref:Uncharacterized protein n=1 Tax=Rhododendron griersonianum TaxID=479676 RepID=A0AAV6JXM9_9ERIC|nr:hypothetical protein RHGRI_017400 [Rhododendron griersonianum]